MTRADDEAKAKAEADAKAKAGKATDTQGGTEASAGAGAGAGGQAAGDEPIDETKSLPDRWEVGQTEAEADANTQIAKQREEDAKARDEQIRRESADARDASTPSDEKKQQASDATLKAVDEKLAADKDQPRAVR